MIFNQVLPKLFMITEWKRLSITCVLEIYFLRNPEKAASRVYD